MYIYIYIHDKYLASVLKKENPGFGTALPRGFHWELTIYSEVSLSSHHSLICLYHRISFSGLYLLLFQVAEGVLIVHPPSIPVFIIIGLLATVP